MEAWQVEAAQIDLQIREQLTIIRQHQQTVNQLRQRKRELTAAHSNLGEPLAIHRAVYRAKREDERK